jgi:hypothetical protein
MLFEMVSAKLAEIPAVSVSPLDWFGARLAALVFYH